MEKFELNDIEKKACEYLKLDPSSFSNKESLLKEIKAKGLVIENNNLIDNQMETLVYSGAPENDEERKLKKSHEYSLRDDGINPNDLPSSKKEEEEELRPTEGKPALVPTNENLDWIEQKVQDYTKMKEAGNASITAITPDMQERTFTAEIDNATVTYSSPNDCVVSKGANYVVFDTMMKEPSNVGKAVRIPEDASPEFKTNLFVAAVLNGHKVNGAEDLTYEQLVANIELIRYLHAKFPIKYVFGHYQQVAAQMSGLYKENVDGYYSIKSDPGALFMRELRENLANEGLLFFAE